MILGAETMSQDISNNPLNDEYLKNHIKKLCEDRLKKLFLGGDPQDHLEVGTPEVIRRINNKTGKEKKVLRVPIYTKTPEGLIFLYEDGGRNIIKIEHYLEGYIDHWEKSFPTNLQKLDSVRIDVGVSFDFANSSNNKSKHNDGEISNIKAIGYEVALKTGLIHKNSPIDKFYRNVLDRRSRKNLLVYAHSELVGPSIHLAELAKYASRALADVFMDLYSVGDIRLKILDLFSGSGAVTSAVLDLGFHTSVCVDLNVKPAQNFLVPKRKRNVVFVVKDIFSLEKEFFSQGFDIVTADPPHILVWKFLKDKHLLKWIYENSLIFIMYYSHIEQKEWSRYVLKTLKFGINNKRNIGFNPLYDITAGGEKLALGIGKIRNRRLRQAIVGHIERALENYAEQMKRNYGIDVEYSTDILLS